MELIQPGLGLVFWMTVTFSLVLFILTKFAWKPILKALKEREDTIENALNSAEKAKQEIQKSQAENQRILDEARLERDKVLKEAQATANNIINEAKEKANSEGAKLLDNARTSIQTEKAAALTEIKNLVGTLSVQIAEQMLKKELNNDSSNLALIQQYLNDAKLN
ncbi:MAG TPA: ATP synthase F0 subunit B [Cytophagales bacterium]|nr:ATP synthase F0 subunit B [Cytophagales bacterium]